MKQMLIAISLLALTACGGGSANDKPSTSSSSSSSAKTFSLKKLNSTALGVVYTTQLVGIDSYNYQYTGVFSITNRAEINSNGVMATPRETLLTTTLADNTSASATVTSTSYIETATGNLLSLTQQPTGISCTSVSPYHMPDSVKVGDADIMSSLSCSNNTTQFNSWRAEAAGNNIRVVTTSVVKNSLGNNISEINISYTLNEAGNIISFKEVITSSSTDLILTLTSK